MSKVSWSDSDLIRVDPPYTYEDEVEFYVIKNCMYKLRQYNEWCEYAESDYYDGRPVPKDLIVTTIIRE